MQQIQYDTRPGEFADAMKTTRAARMFFWLVLGAAILCQLAGFCLIEYGGVLGEKLLAAAATTAPAPGEAAPAAATPPAKPKPPAPAPKPKPKNAKPAATPAAGPAKDKPASRPTTQPAPRTAAEKWHLALAWALPASKFVALIAAMLLLLTLLLALNLSLVGKLGGTAGLISAFFWALLLFAMVMPWQQVLAKRTLACGALFNLGELLAGRARWLAPRAGSQGATFYLARFILYPLLALLLWIVVHVKFVRACMRMHYPHSLPSQTLGPAKRRRRPGSQGQPVPAPPAGAAEETDTPGPDETPGKADKPKKPSVLGSVTERFFRPGSDD